MPDATIWVRRGFTEFEQRAKLAICFLKAISAAPLAEFIRPWDANSSGALDRADDKHHNGAGCSRLDLASLRQAQGVVD